nr:hypothetical protein [Mesorhizobium sp.]
MNLLINPIVYWNHALSRTCFRRTQPGGHFYAARRHQAYYPARLAAHQSHRRLHLDSDRRR